MYEDYAEGRISKEKYLSDKKGMFVRQEETAARLPELSEQLARVQKHPMGQGADLAKYELSDSLTRELLVELVKEIRVSGTDTIEIKWNR